MVKGKVNESLFQNIEDTRNNLLQNQTIIAVNDLGSRSLNLTGNKRKIADVAATSLSKKNYCELFYRIAEYIDAGRILELGTSMGITTLYLSMKENAKVFTFEGNPDIIHIAQTNFESFEKQNIQLVDGNLDETLSDFLQDPAKIDFVLMDANHRYEPTMRYFNMLSRRMSDKGIIIADDIHRSLEMEMAWMKMKTHDLVYGSIDLYKCGILFFDLSLTRKHFVWSI